MSRMIPSRLIRPVAAIALAIGPITAHAEAPRSFNDIEYGMTGDDVPASEQALAERLAPRGAPIAEAVAALRHAGANPLKPAAGGDLRFVYVSSDFVDDMQRDIRVVIRLPENDGRVGAVLVKRNTYGG